MEEDDDRKGEIEYKMKVSIIKTKYTHTHIHKFSDILTRKHLLHSEQ